ncbi:MAG: lamin tail domain-containing protein [Candidatus Aureabacteria bacterium]|nr:lamin tail domain-containing protein [Candidatus Auribacterota bacterium]
MLGIGRWPMECVFADADYVYGASADNFIYVWNRSDFSFNTRLNQPERKPGPGGIMVAAASDSSHIYGGSGDFDDTLYVWNRADFSPVTAVKAGADDLNALAVSGGNLYAANADGTIRVWDAAALAPIKTLTQSTGGMTSVAPSSSFLYAGNSNGSVYAWDRSGYSLLTRLRAGEQGVLWVWADDDLILASSQDGNVYVWQAPSALPARELGWSAGPSPTPGGARSRFAPTPGGRGDSNVDQDDFSPLQPTPFHWDYKPTPMPYDPSNKTLDYPNLDDTYKKVYKDLFGIILTTPTPAPTAPTTPTPEAVPTGSPGTGNVTINEVNWGGTMESDTGEWIELFNSGSAVDLSDWVISVDNATTTDWTFTLSGISISNYLVLARGTDPTGGKADFIYPAGNIFDNKGATITLINPSGQTQDTLSFSGGWPAGAQGISMERVTVGGSSWAAALVTAIYGDLMIDRGTPRAPNSVSSASGLVAGAATGNLKLQDYADWIDFEKGNYFKLFEWDLSKRPKSTALLDYLPKTAFLYLATGYRPDADYFRTNLLAMVRDNSLDWAGEETCRYIADVAEAYAAMRSAGFFSRLERREIENAFVKLALAARENYNYGTYAQGIVCGLNAAVGYIVGGKQGTEMIAWSNRLLSYDTTWTLPEDSRHYQGLFLRETLRVALYSNGMNIPDKDEKGKVWKDNFIQQINWIINTFPHNGFCPSYGRDYRQNYIDHYMLPLIVATTVLDDGDPGHQRLAQEAKWLAEKMFYYGTHHTVSPYGQNAKGYEAAQWGPFAILLNPIYLWWFLNEDIESQAPDAAVHGSQVIYRARMPEGAIAAVYDESFKQLKIQMDKIVHRSSWGEDALFALIDPAYPAAKNGENKHDLAGNLISLSYGPEEFLTGLTLSFWNGEKKRVNVADILDDYTGAELSAWEDNDRFSRSLTKVKDKRGTWTREVTLYKTEDVRLEVKDTLSKGGSVYWHLQGTPQWGTNEVVLDVNGTQLKASWEGADGMTRRDVDTWSDPQPLKRWCYSGNPDREVKLTRSAPGTITTVFRGVKISAPEPLPSASPSESAEEIPGS